MASVNFFRLQTEKEIKQKMVDSDKIKQLNKSAVKESKLVVYYFSGLNQKEAKKFEDKQIGDGQKCPLMNS